MLEPSGTICSLHNPMTTSGGVLVEDSFSGGPHDSKRQYREHYVCAQAFPGEYNLLIRRMWGRVTADTVTVEIRQRGQKPIRRQVKLRGTDALGVMQLDEGRRQLVISEEMVAAARRKEAQERNERALYAKIQKSEAKSHADSMASASDDRRRERRRQIRRRRGAVGYRVTPTILPEGTALTATGVVSGDRRYVRTTAFPFFSGIGDVTVFDVSGGQTPGAGGGSGGNPGGGQGGGGAGGGR
ncbi:MAG TPA: hypothetical protein ENJ50_05550 [Planctomycetaceae bacterium]|nr:hypothetical protein [Planctomycetaceae bacterium]